MQNEIVFQSAIWRPLFALILASIVVMGSPGPSTISATAMGAAYGVRRSLGYVCGLILGTIAVLLTVSIGVVALVMSLPHAARLLGGASAIYILYLAFKIATAPPLDRRGGELSGPAFLGGVLLAIANPKAYLAIAAVFAGSTIVVEDQRLDALAKTLLLAAMIVVIHLVWLSAGAFLSRLLQDPVHSRLINVSLAVLLVIMTFLSLRG